MASSRYEGDPFSNTGTVYLPDGTAIDSTVEAFTNGRFTIDRGQLVDTTNSFNRMTLGQQGGVTLYDAGDGRLSVSSQTQLGLANRPLQTDQQRFASGTVDVFSPISGLTSLEFSDAVISRIGYQWLAYPREDGTVGLTRSPTIFQSNAEVQAALGAQFRLATPEEAILYAAAFDIISKNANDVLDLLRESGLGTTEELSTYDLAQMLLLQYGSLRDVSMYTRTLIGGPGD